MVNTKPYRVTLGFTALSEIRRFLMFSVPGHCKIFSKRRAHSSVG